jgi:predicted ATPase
MEFKGDLHIVKEEIYDADVMESILRDVNTYSKSELNRLRSYKKSRKYGNKVDVIYYYGKGCEENELGRLYVKNNRGLQSFQREIRDALLEKHHFSIDMENAHYNLMIKLGREWNINVNNIIYYCENRNECLKMLSDDKRVSKIAYLKVAYGGNISLYDSTIGEYVEPEGDTRLLKELEKEVKSLIEMCYGKYPEHHNLVKKKENPKVTLFALILQTEERKCLLALDEYLQSQGRQTDVLIHDGLEVIKKENEIKFPEELLRGGERAIKEKTGYEVKLVQKAYENKYKKEEKEKIIIDDVYATRKFINLMKDNISRDNGEVYYFNDDNGMWEKGDTAFKTAIIKVKEEMVFTDYSESKPKIINYGGKLSYMKSIQNLVLSQLSEDNFITKNMDSSIGKLLFIDGYYDFYKNEFIEGFDNKIVFLKRINRLFPREKNEEKIKEVNKILFIDAFNFEDGLDSGEYFKKVLCMGLIGDYYRKKIFFVTGKTNSGKGVLVKALRESFEGYIDEFDANNLLYNSNTQDEAKKLAWTQDLIGRRISLSNECRMDKKSLGFDGNLIKTLSSGSDIMKHRTNHENQTDFINRSTLFLLSNDVPNITPVDSGVIDRAKFIRYTLSFINNPVKSNERKLDASIKMKFTNEEYKNALLYLMIDTFNNLKNEEKVLNGNIPEPKSVLLETSEWIKDENLLFEEKILERYEITNKKEDYVESKEIINYITKECEMNFSAVKIGRLLTNLINVEPRDMNIKNVKCRLGIKEKD